MTEVIDSLKTPFKAIVFMGREKSLWALIAPVLLVGFFLYGAGFVYLIHHLPQWVEPFLPSRETWWGGALYLSVTVLLTLLGVLAFAFLFGTFGGFLLAPFSEAISERTEKVLGVPPLDAVGKGFVRDLPRVFRIEFLKFLFSVAITILFFGVGFLFPPLAILGTLASFWFLGFHYCDYSLERRRWPFLSRLRWGFDRSFHLVSFGAVLMAIISVPILGVIGLPAGVVGGTMLFHRLNRKGHR